MFSVARSVRAIARVIPKRHYAAAAPAADTASEELLLTFSSPSTAFYTNKVVKQVDVPTLAGTVGVLAKHVPTIGVLKPGVVQVIELDGNVKKMFVSSGTMSMNIDGTLQVLAEEAINIEDIDETKARHELEAAQRKGAEGGSEVDRAEAAIRAEVAEALVKAATGQV
uniref:ATP synthase F1 complex delta/epsilon subunit N-terminal domain-containing protein n=1 Tax=Panagrolaimus sp. JU765 TaxID=591449 RepID=A0AC34R3B3_9BILA